MSDTFTLLHVPGNAPGSAAVSEILSKTYTNSTIITHSLKDDLTAALSRTVPHIALVHQNAAEHEFDIVTHIHSIKPGLPVIVILQDHDTAATVAAVKQGAADVIALPDTPRLLPGALKSLVQPAPAVPRVPGIIDTVYQGPAFLEDVLNSIQDGISVLDTGLNIIKTNKIMEEWYAMHTPLAGKKCFACYQNASSPCDPCPSLRCIQSGKTESDEVPGVPGSPAEWIELFSYPIKDPETGTVRGVVEFVRDITLRKKAEKKVDHLTRVLRAIRNVNQVITKEKNPEKLIQQACALLTETSGYINSWIVLFTDRRTPQIINGSGLGSRLEALEKYIRNGSLPRCAQAALDKPGIVVSEPAKKHCGTCPVLSEMPDYNALTTTLIHGGKLYGVFSVYLHPRFAHDPEEHELFREVADDIAFALYSIQTEKERLSTEEALRESEKKFRSVVEYSHDGIIMIDEKSNIVYTNTVIQKLYGYAKKNALGKDFRDFLTPESRKNADEIFTLIQQGKECAEKYELSLFDSHGYIRQVEIKSSVISDERSRPLTILQLMDITEQRKAEAVQAGLYKITREALEAENMEALYISIHETIAEFMPAHNFYIALYDPEKNMISFPYFVDQEDEQPEPYTFGSGLTEYVIRTGKPLLVHPAEHKRLIKEGSVVMMGEPSACWLGVPLIVDRQTIGVMALNSYSDANLFTMEQKDILSFISAQVAMAIKRTQINEEILRNMHEKEVLLQEIHHRVKNNLQVISSLLNLQSRKIQGGQAYEAFQDSRRRVRSIAMVHEKLYHTENLSAIDLSDYLRSLTDEIIYSHSSSASLPDVTVKSDAFDIDISTAIPLGLITNELVTNALKYAFPGGAQKGDAVSILCTCDEARALKLVVKDNGTGMPHNMDFETTDSMGLHLVRLLATYQLGGTITLSRENGTAFCLQMTL